MKPIWRWLRDQQWWITAAAVAAVLILGTVGYRQLGVGWSSAIYSALQLFFFQSDGTREVPWTLDAARYLAMLVGAFAALKALWVLFSKQRDLILAGRWRDHVVVCGLGRKGLLLVRGFLAQGRRVVAIERQGDNSAIEECRELGAVVLVGDVLEGDLLRKAGVRRARHLVAVCADDTTNAEIAVRAEALTRERLGPPLTATVHLVNPQLCHLLREREIGSGDGDRLHLEFFNIYERGARILLSEHPPLAATGQADAGPPHLLVVGLGPLGESLVVQAARIWWTGRDADRPAEDGAERRLRITVVDSEAERKTAALCARHPALRRSCELIACSIDTRDAAFERADCLVGPDGNAVTAAYVCLDDDSAALSAALTLLRRTGARDLPIVVSLSRDVGLARLLNASTGGTFKKLDAFELLDRTCTPELLVGGTHEVLARALHEEFLRTQRAAGTTAEANPWLVPWDQLSEEVKDLNRSPAAHIPVKLAAVGCYLEPLADWDATPIEFTPNEVEVMAQLEHERWMAERFAAGWKLGPTDRAKKTHADLVPWEQLDEEAREKDRVFVRKLPADLAAAGFRVVRRAERSGAKGETRIPVTGVARSAINAEGDARPRTD